MQDATTDSFSFTALDSGSTTQRAAVVGGYQLRHVSIPEPSTLALLTLFFPKMADVMPPAMIFGFFCFMMVLQLVWVKFMVPETKNAALEDMERKLGIRPLE